MTHGLDDDRVTKRFFSGLASTTKRTTPAAKCSPRQAGPGLQAIEAADGPQRVALRLVNTDRLLLLPAAERPAARRARLAPRHSKRTRPRPYYQRVLEHSFTKCSAVRAGSCVRVGTTRSPVPERRPVRAPRTARSRSRSQTRSSRLTRACSASSTAGRSRSRRRLPTKARSPSIPRCSARSSRT